MYGAIIGDIIGSTYEFRGIKTKRFLLFPWFSAFTDDSIMTIAVARALMEWQKQGGDLHDTMVSHMRELGRKYPEPAGSYGHHFKRWLTARNPRPYKSCGNGSAMRVSPCGLLANSLEEALTLAKISAEVTHNSYEGIKGAEAVAAAVYLAKTGHSKDSIRHYINKNFYRLDKTLAEIRPVYRFNSTCQGSVPQSIIAFLESESYEDAIRNAISLGGDADTMAAITGSIAWSYYQFKNLNMMDDNMRKLFRKALKYIPREFAQTADEFWILCQHRRSQFAARILDAEREPQLQKIEERITMPPLILTNR